MEFGRHDCCWFWTLTSKNLLHSPHLAFRPLPVLSNPSLPDRKWGVFWTRTKWVWISQTRSPSMEFGSFNFGWNDCSQKGQAHWNTNGEKLPGGVPSAMEGYSSFIIYAFILFPNHSLCHYYGAPITCQVLGWHVVLIIVSQPAFIMKYSWFWVFAHFWGINTPIRVDFKLLTPWHWAWS